MGKASKVKHVKSCSKRQHTSPHQIQSPSPKCFKDACRKKKNSKITSVKEDWEDSRCSVCMESPHNAVLLLCSSYSKGCRPYMCATGHRFSNCLEQYRKAYTKLTSLQCSEPFCEPLSPAWPDKPTEIPQLSCPICRGQVKGWTVVEPARKALNKKKRSCMQENCLFVGNYKQLKKHVKADHPLSRPPREVDPVLEEKWKDLERERERNDVISAITSSDPGAIVRGDFVIEGGQNSFYRIYDELDEFLEGPQFDLFRGGGGGGGGGGRSGSGRVGLFVARRARLRAAAARGLMLPSRTT